MSSHNESDVEDLKIDFSEFTSLKKVSSEGHYIIYKAKLNGSEYALKCVDKIPYVNRPDTKNLNEEMFTKEVRAKESNALDYDSLRAFTFVQLEILRRVGNLKEHVIKLRGFSKGLVVSFFLLCRAPINRFVTQPQTRTTAMFW